MTTYCSIQNVHIDGTVFVNGPYATREIAKATVANMADDHFKRLKAEDPSIEWELDADDEVVGIYVNGECEVEWHVHELIPYEN